MYSARRSDNLRRNISDAAMAPSPRGRWLLGHLSEFRHDVLGLLDRAAQSGHPVLRYRLGPQLVHLINDPEGIRHVLQENNQNYNKATRSSSRIMAVSGESLLVSNGAFWLRQRRLMQPAFHHERLANLVTLMTGVTEGMLARWQQLPAESSLDIASEMMHVTFTVVGRALFSTDLSRTAAAVESAMSTVLEFTYERLERIVDFPLRIPTTRNRRFRAALRQLDEIVYRLIAERRQHSLPPVTSANDLLEMLLRARDEESGENMTDQQVRDETITFLLAGHETTANALTWVWYLLAKHPEIEQRLHHEISDVLNGRPPAFSDLPRLQYTQMIIREAMRLYPPIWIIERNVIADDVVSGFRLPARSSVVISPYALHRTPEFWTEPTAFLPQRFADESQIPRFTYIPFGAGPRLCIGNHFALMEAQIIIAMIVQRYRLSLVSSLEIEPKPGITLRTPNGLRMRLETR